MSDSYDDYETKIQLAEQAWEKRVDEMVKTEHDRAVELAKAYEPNCGRRIMDREDIIRMAREAGLAYGSDEKPLNSVTRFATLVAKHEREACAKVCDAEASIEGIAQRCADAIRARGMRHE